MITLYDTLLHFYISDAFEQPLTVTNANEQISLSALGDTVTDNPIVGDVVPQSDPLLDTPNALSSDPDPAGLPNDTIGTTLPPVIGEGSIPLSIEGEAINVPVKTIDTSPGDVTVLGSDMIQVGDGGVMAVDNLETTTQGGPITTVDSNFDPQGTFDGRSDPILLTGTVPSTNVSKPLANATSVENVVAATENEVLVDIQQESVTSNILPEGVTDKSTINPNPDSNVLTPEGTVDIINSGENATLPETIQNVVERPSVVDQTTPTNFMDKTTSIEQIYEEKLKEFESFANSNPNSNFPGPPPLPPRRDQRPRIPPSDEPPMPSGESVLEPTSLDSVDQRPPIPSSNIPLTPSGESLIEQTSLDPVDTIVQEGVISDTIIDPTLPSPRPTPGLNRVVTTARTPSVLSTESTLESNTLLENPSPSPSAEPVVRPKNRLVEPSPPPSSRVVPNRQRSRPRTPMVAPPPPPPPSEIFRTDFNENTSRRANQFKYEPEIPYDPDFDFKTKQSFSTAKTTNTPAASVKYELEIPYDPDFDSRTKQSFSTAKTTNTPAATATKTANTVVSDIRSVYDKNSHQNNAYPFAHDESRKQTREYVGKQRDSGMSLIQYQLTNRNEERRTNALERKNNQMKVRNQSRRTSNDMQAKFDKDRNFEASFGEPGVPFHSDYFNQNQNIFPYEIQRSNNADRFNSNANRQSETILSSNRRPSRFTQDSVNTRSNNDRRMTMPPIVVVEDGTQLGNENSFADRGSVAARFQQREFENSQMTRTNAPYINNRMENSLEMWYQLLGKDLQENEIREFQNGINVRKDARNMGGRVLNNFWYDSNNAGSPSVRSTNGPRNSRMNNVNSEPVRKQAGNLASDTRRQNQGSQTTVRRNNAFVFEPQRPISQTNRPRDQQRTNKESKSEIQKNNAFVFEPRKSQINMRKDRKPVMDSRTTFNNNNAFVFEPQRSQIEVTDAHRRKIREYTITRTPDLVSTTEARLNMGVPTLSKPLEPEVISNMLFSQDNPPPISIDGKFDNIAFQSLVTTPRPNTVLQPSVVPSNAFRNRERSVQAPDARNFESLKTRVTSIKDLPIPPSIKQILPSSSSNRVNSNSQARPSSNQIEKIDLNVEPKLNAVPFVPAEPMVNRRVNNIGDLPKPPAIAFGKSSNNGPSSNVVNNVDSGPSPTANAQPFRELPEVTPVPPLFSVNSTIVMKLQNDSVTKEELPPSKFPVIRTSMRDKEH